MNSLSLWTPPVFTLTQPRLDVHVTLRLTTRLLATLPSRCIHPRLVWIFGSHVCTYGDLITTPDMIREIIHLSRSLPREPKVYTRSIVYSLYERVKEDIELHAMVQRDIGCMLYFALLGPISTKALDCWCDEVDNETRGRIPDRKKLHQFVCAIRNQLDRKPLIKLHEIVSDYILCIVRYEYVDRVEVALQVMHSPYYFPHYVRVRLLLGMFHRCPEWRREYMAYIASRLLRCPSRELSRKYTGLVHDLGAFLFTLRQIRVDYGSLVTTPEVDAFFRTEFPWTETDAQLKCTLFLALLTPFAKELLHIKRNTEYRLTPSEYTGLWKTLDSRNPYTFISVEAFVRNIVLSPEHRPNPGPVIATNGPPPPASSDTPRSIPVPRPSPTPSTG